MPDDMVEAVARAIAIEVDRQARVGKWVGKDLFVPDDGPLNVHSVARAAMLAMRDGSEAVFEALHREVLIEANPAERSCSIINERHVWESLIDAALTGTMKE